MWCLLACAAAPVDTETGNAGHSGLVETADRGETGETGVPGPLPYVERDGMDFVRDGEPFRFIGFNTRGIVHFGGGDLLPTSSEADIATTLDTVEAIGATVVRVFAANEQITAELAAERLATFLDLAEARGIYVIAVLTDPAGSGFSPAGDESSFVSDELGNRMLGPEWYAGGYTVSYLPWVQTVVARNAGHRALLAWELANEPHTPFDDESLLTWVEASTATIRALDDQALVSGGLMGTAMAGLNTDQCIRFYAGLDFITVHTYDEFGSGDLSLSADLALPLIAEASGFSGNNRPNQVKWNAEQMIAGGAEGYMQWGFMATEVDIGDGDDLVGMDRVNYEDWDELVTTYQDLVGRL